jgi:3-hydroxy-3-methylglutaryl CoA synthase
MSAPVGIDDMNVYASTLSVDFSEIVSARGISDKDWQSVGFVRRSVVPAFEDPVTLAVNAAQPIVEAAGRGAFELLIVASESGMDFAKPLSSYIHKYLGLGRRCRNVELKHACYAGTSGFQMAAAWARSELPAGKKALVVTTDIGRRHFNESAELSVSAGAIALSVSTEPRIFELEPQSGYVSQEVYDTARPTATSEWINPPLSLSAYLDLLEMAWADYQVVSQVSCFQDHFAYMIYHTPLMSLIERAHQILTEDGREETTPDDVKASFARMVEPSLRYNRIVGNIYSGTLYLALAGLIDSVRPASKTRVGCFSYGSGSCAEFFSGFIGSESQARLAGKRIGEHLAARRRLSVDEYEHQVLELEHSMTSKDYEPDRQNLVEHYDQAYRGRGLLVLENVRNYYRQYAWS